MKTNSFTTTLTRWTRTASVWVILLTLYCSAQAQTNSPIVQFAYDVKSFFTDTTNIFNKGVVAVEAGPVFGLVNGRFGADADVQFPIAQQASVGFDLLFYNHNLYDGTFNSTLGTTWNVPVIGNVYTYGQVGVGTDLQNSNNIINEEWAGAKWKYQFGGSFTNLNLTANIAAGHISNEQGALIKTMLGLEYRW